LGAAGAGTASKWAGRGWWGVERGIVIYTDTHGWVGVFLVRDVRHHEFGWWGVGL